MDTRRLRTLLAVARTGSVVAAAEELFITPSAVSQQLKQLEREAGRTLVMRTSRGMALTPAGLIAAEAAEEIERVVGSANDRLRETNGPSGSVRIGGLASFLRGVLTPRLTEWRERFPGLQVQLVEGNTSSLTRSLRRRELDAAIVELDSDVEDDPLPASITEHVLLDEPWKLVAPAAWRVDSQRTDGSRAAFPWLGVDAPTTQSAIERLRRLIPLESTPVHLYYESMNGVALVAAEQGVTVMPALTLRGFIPDTVRVLDIPGLGVRSLVLRRFAGEHLPGSAIGTVSTLVREAVNQFDFDSGPWAASRRTARDVTEVC